ncbi:MAG: Unknown protein [uncultured Sulfurovum sp.]|uniref:beta-lactamase n=1 Tax=uncultured Sulfurovum sp. TaxID=269237 RepID=A0A6S6SAJ7_9BACT|nr:MAG: Unknown protein [uncultured Sulfurovum sp.]
MNIILLLIVLAINLSASDFKKYEIECANNLSMGCRERAYLALEINRSYDEAEKYFLRACELKDAKSCQLLGYMYGSSNANKQDSKKRFDFFKKACQLGNAESCTVIGSIYSSKKHSNSTKKNMIKVKIEDLIQATKYYEKACKLGDQRGCGRFGATYLLGYGIKNDQQKAIKIFKDTCKKTSYYGCSLYISLTGHNMKYRDLYISEERILRKGCELNVSNACNDLGFLSLEVYQDYSKAEKYFRQACQLQNQESCKMLGFMYESNYTGKKDFKKSFYYFNRACELDNGYACQYTGLMYWSGKSIKKDWTKSAQLYQKSCDLEYSSGCRSLGSSYYLGEGVEINRRKGIELYKQACTKGEHYGCLKYIGFATQQ